ncbi:PD-(D/E)XK nuclease family protein [Bifidobacterium actinocoloniiforme]|nr:PD-(D/E)XK nuclease family protein [Bifidobacterium actinocoloniiforme]
MTRAKQVDMGQALQAVERLIAGDLNGEDGLSSTVLCLAGPPRSGKTTFAQETLLAALAAYGDGGAVMVVSGRHAADQISKAVIARRGASSQSRPVGTLQALAFRLLSQSSASQEGRALPKLLNGAEQDALLRQVMARHIAHVEAGDDCPSCRLLERYFSSQAGLNGARGWSGVLTQATVRADDLAGRIDDDFIAQLRDMLARTIELGVGPSDQGPILDALSSQALDLDERDRLGVQWRLAFALGQEYMEQVDAAYPDQYRLDPSMLLVSARRAVEEDEGLGLPALVVVDDWQDLTMAGMGFIQALVQRGVRLVLAGDCDESVQSFRGSYPEFLDARVGSRPVSLAGSGAGNGPAQALLDPDLGRLGAVRLSLPYRPITLPEHSPSEAEGVKADGPASYADLLAARVSLSILSEEGGDTGLPDRPGKMPAWPGAGPIGPLDPDSPLLADGTVVTRLLRTPDEEEDDVVWQIKHEYLSGHWDWNDMAVIAHDNATVRSLGAKLRAEGVPVRYSSIARPLKDEPTVQGLFALIELAQAQAGTVPGWQDLSATDQASWVGQRLRRLLASPLLSAPLPGGQSPRPVRVERVDALLSVLSCLTRIGPDQQTSSGAAEITAAGGAALAAEATNPAKSQDSPEAPGAAAGTGQSRPVAALSLLAQVWRSYASGREREIAAAEEASGISVDDSLMGGASAPSVGAGPGQSGFLVDADAIGLLLLLDSAIDGQASGDAAGQAPAEGAPDAHGDSGPESLRQSVLEALAAIADPRRSDPDLKALAHALDLADRTARDLAALDDPAPEYALWQAWSAVGVADDWQAQALAASQEGEEANDRLDAMMRLFQFASSSQEIDNINDFLAQVKDMQIEADSLACVGPVEHAVRLTTPAGAAALATSWPVVWLPALQEGVWPNLAPRDTLFGGEDLADLILHDSIRSAKTDAGGHDPRLRATLYTEEKGLLAAISRARTQVRFSAVWNDQNVPSAFLYGFLPERYPRLSDPSQADFSPVGGEADASTGLSGLEVGPRGLVAVARSILSRQALGAPISEQDPLARDAAAALRLLAEHGLHEADPASWPFLYARTRPVAGPPSDPSAAPGVSFAEPSSAGPSAGGLPSDGPSSTGGASAEAAGPGGGSSRVTLSPSAVDRIWACPLEWVLDDRVSGPRPGSVAMSFGSLIHQVAQEAADQGLDQPERGDLGVDAVSDAELINRTQGQMMDIYHELSRSLPAYPSPKDSYDARRRDSHAQGILTNIASYFVMSAKEGYAQEGKAGVPVGVLTSSSQEQDFRASFRPVDFAPVWNATFQDCALGGDEFFALASALVGGFPQALKADSLITLTGRIDRLERRSIEGEEHLRLVDYKTGRSSHNAKQIFNDLQLVCYQLGLAYQEGESRRRPASGADRGASQSGRALRCVHQSGSRAFFQESRGRLPTRPLQARGLQQHVRAAPQAFETGSPGRHAPLAPAGA